jgi:electron transfer flavoprotein alpha subunit
MSGVDPATTVVAVNHDANAAIFGVANYGGVFDAMALARELDGHC